MNVVTLASVPARPSDMDTFCADLQKLGDDMQALVDAFSAAHLSSPVVAMVGVIRVVEYNLIASMP